MMTTEMWVWLVIYGLVLYEAMMLTKGCQFPDMLQTNYNTSSGSSSMSPVSQSYRDWSSVIRDQYTTFTLNIKVAGSVIHANSSDSSVSSYSYLCVQRVTTGKYLVLYEAPGQTTSLYTCLQFIFRSASVVQVKVAPRSFRMNRTACADSSLELDGWLWVDRRHVVSEQVLCSLQGGFIVRLYDRSRPSGVCTLNRGETRLESECAKGEGMIFNFRHERCVPDRLEMDSVQRMVCAVTWREGAYSFTLFRDDTLRHFWLLRHLTTGGDSFTAYLFFDLNADRRDPSQHDANAFLRLDVVRDTPQPVTSLCLDDVDMCAGRGAAACAMRASQEPLYCPRTCGICDASRPALCRFDDATRGQWYSGALTTNLVLSVNASTAVSHEQVREAFHCISWQQQQPTSKHTMLTARSSQPFISYMLVSDYDNGCRPRYSCLSIAQNSSTLVAFMRISQTRTWPFTPTPDTPLTCSRSFIYEDDVSLFPNELRASRMTLLYRPPVISQSMPLVRCHLPLPVGGGTGSRSSSFSSGERTKLFVRFRDGERCWVTIDTSADNTVISVVLQQPCIMNLFMLERQYLCLESIRLPPSNDLVIVARSAGAHWHLVCWIFERKSTALNLTPFSTFYVVDAADCDDMTRQRISERLLQPLATFSLDTREDDEEGEEKGQGQGKSNDLQGAERVGTMTSSDNYVIEDAPMPPSSRDLIIEVVNFTYIPADGGKVSMSQEEFSAYTLLTTLVVFVITIFARCLGC